MDRCEPCWKQAAESPAAPQPDSASGQPASAHLTESAKLALRSLAKGGPPNEAGPVLPKVGDAFSVWKGTFQAELPPPEVLKKETAESLLRKLIKKNDPHFRNTIFILAVMLERKRILAAQDRIRQDMRVVCPGVIYVNARYEKCVRHRDVGAGGGEQQWREASAVDARGSAPRPSSKRTMS